jgi:RES domain-containing protein
VPFSDRALAAALGRAVPTRVRGNFERHVSPSIHDLRASVAGGRWGPPDAYPVLYLGRPIASVIAEAYRLLVDEVEGMTADLVGPRRLLCASVAVTDILDLRDRGTRKLVGLGDLDLAGPHDPCQRVGCAAHRYGLHGVIAPAATGLGQTLALFADNLPEAQLPVLTATKTWRKLPPDPRLLRGVDPAH